jgi:hypothetical protein
MGPFSNISLKLVKVGDDGIEINSWILNDITITYCSFLFNPAITNIEQETITVMPKTFWQVD